MIERQVTVPDVLERVLDKGIVFDAWVRVTVVGIDLLTVDARIVVASLETYLKYANELSDVEVGASAVTDRPRRARKADDPIALRIVRQAFDAWNGHDPEQYAALLDETYIGETHRLPTPVRGPQAACEAMQAYFNVLPDLHFRIEAAVAAGEDVLVSWLATGTPQGVYISPSLAPRPLHVPGCTITRLRDRKIVHTWNYWDSPACCP